MPQEAHDYKAAWHKASGLLHDWYILFLIIPFLFKGVRDVVSGALDALLIFLSPVTNTIGAAASIITTRHGELFALVITLLFLYLIYRIPKSYGAKLNALRFIREASVTHMEFSSEIAKLAVDLSDCPLGDVPALRDELDRLLAPHLKFLCDNVSQSFQFLTGTSCHVSIKSLMSEDGPDKGAVKTLTRCSLANFVDRRESDDVVEMYSFKANTAFDAILSNRKVRRYSSNHLFFWYLLGRYKNANPDWRKFYNATHVVPICSFTNESLVDENTTKGFLCVDNLRGGFRGGTQYIILTIYAAIILDTFDRAGRLVKQIEDLSKDLQDELKAGQQDDVQPAPAGSGNRAQRKAPRGERI